jgi:Icc-related predicted phosphoesterase
MRILAFSDLHRDEAAAQGVVRRANEADVIVIAGDLATKRVGLEAMVEVLRSIVTPTVVVPGNSESDLELEAACTEWTAAHVLHGSGVEIGGVAFWGLGGAVPVTPFGSWSFDLDESDAADLLAGCPEGAVLVSHSPPYGLADGDAGGRHLGSRAVLAAARRARTQLVICGHIHASWGKQVSLGETLVVNAGPRGAVLDVGPTSGSARSPT